MGTLVKPYSVITFRFCPCFSSLSWRALMASFPANCRMIAVFPWPNDNFSPNSIIVSCIKAIASVVFLTRSSALAVMLIATSSTHVTICDCRIWSSVVSSKSARQSLCWIVSKTDAIAYENNKSARASPGRDPDLGGQIWGDPGTIYQVLARDAETMPSASLDPVEARMRSPCPTCLGCPTCYTVGQDCHDHHPTPLAKVWQWNRRLLWGQETTRHALFGVSEHFAANSVPGGAWHWCLVLFALPIGWEKLCMKGLGP